MLVITSQLKGFIIKQNFIYVNFLNNLKTERYYLATKNQI